MCDCQGGWLLSSQSTRKITARRGSARPSTKCTPSSSQRAALERRLCGLFGACDESTQMCSSAPLVCTLQTSARFAGRTSRSAPSIGSARVCRVHEVLFSSPLVSSADWNSVFTFGVRAAGRAGLSIKEEDCDWIIFFTVEEFDASQGTEKNQYPRKSRVSQA